MRTYLILAMCGLFLGQYFVQSRWLDMPLLALALAAFADAAAKADRAPKWFGIGMLVVGTALEFQKGRGIAGISEGIAMNLPLITLVILVPLLSVPLRLGGYFDAIDELLRRLKHHPRKLFAGITGVLFALGPILNIGSIRLVDELLKRLGLAPRMLARSYMVGFSTTMLWSPYYASVALVLYYLKVPVAAYMAYGIGLALLFVVSGNVVFAFRSRRHSVDADAEAGGKTDDPSEGTDEATATSCGQANVPPAGTDEASADGPARDGEGYRGKLARLGMIVAGLMTVTFVLEAVTRWSMLVIVSLLAVAFPLLWGLATRDWRRLAAHGADFRDKSVPMMNNEIVLFTSAGFLGNAMQGTGFGSGIERLINSLGQQSFLLLAVAVVVTVVGLTFIGIHPMVIVTALVTQMDAAQLGTTPNVLAMLLMLAWSISSVLSPVNPLNLMVSRLSGLSGLQVGFRENGLHLLIVAVLGLAIITAIH